MKNHIYILSFIFFFICNAAIGQEANSKNLTPIKGELIKRDLGYINVKYIYGKKIYTRKQLGDILVHDKLAWNYYKKYQEKERNAKTSGIVAGGFFTITILTSTILPISVEPNAPSGSSGVEYLVVPFSSTLGGLIAGFIAITSKTSANINFDKSVKYYNGNLENKERIGMHPMHLNLKYSQDGIGLVLNF